MFDERIRMNMLDRCTSKRMYETPEKAAKAAMARAKAGVKYLRVYACPDCGGFHLTSKKVKLSKKDWEAR